MKEQKQPGIMSSITLLQKKRYGCLSKIFCCKCIHCCQDFDFSLLTSENRKDLFHSMIQKYLKKLKNNKDVSTVMDPFFIFIALMLGEQNEFYQELIEIINNQNESTVFSKEDLEYYIPELATFLVFHEELNNFQLEHLMIRACKVDLHFSLKYYFYMKSLEVLNMGEEQRKYEIVRKYNHRFRNMINLFYKIDKNKHISRFLKPQKEILSQELKENIERDELTQSMPFFKEKQKIQQKDETNKENLLKRSIQLQKKYYIQQNNIYQPFIAKKEDYNIGLFESTVYFFSDLVQLSKILVSSSDRKAELTHYLTKMNKKLPATIYIPFTKHEYQDMNVVNIVVDEARVFNTKQRAPILISFQSFYNPAHNEGMSKDKKIRSTRNSQKHIRKASFFEQEEEMFSQIADDDITVDVLPNQGEEIRSSKNSNKSIEKQEKQKKKKTWGNFFEINLKKIKKKILKDDNSEESNDERQNKSSNNPISDPEQFSESEKQENQQSQVLLTQKRKKLNQLFGQSEQDQHFRINKSSPFSFLPGYKLLHIIIKSFDDLRQQNFAMQLLQQFQKIFKTQKLPIKLLPYEVLPLSHQSGIIQCVKNAITIDQLKKKGASLKDLLDDKKKQDNFLYSLVGYSLVTYFLQVKDRHNGNIMIKKNGSIFHIDYGFFLTNSPGKGVQLEKNLPFKLTVQYVQALGGLDSKRFLEFRKLFFQGFNACRKHQHRILILTKLMYTSYGNSMSCFIRGNESIEKLQLRFNPRGIYTDIDLSVFCQGIINSSLDNWRSRWYDKWQYYFQGIFY